ncbi:FAD-dependent oxidoreductase [Bacteroides faecium]|uniref:FAD-dependent oxidoreductase n=1 Tax=Bacteroides faecium TaxID=2715212 RepID=A0A6H0KHB8_9BACE|nr:FAD-dependent oxidoreductase [Bacteroides faecium]QIU92675.1 FAD-dependent oxidoreductase [Bacteroides faecium]
MKNIVNLLALVILFSSFGIVPKEEKYDLIVYGGTSSGIIAAYAASKGGLKVAILEPGKHIGGLTTSGLGHVDIGNPETVGGYAREFLKRVGSHYGKTKIQVDMESSVAENVFQQMLKETGVDVYYHSRLLSRRGVVRQGNKIQNLILEDGREFSARIYIDATYEGDLMAQSGVSYTVGREAIKKYNESSAGIQPYKLVRKYNDTQLKEVKQLSDAFPLDYVFSDREQVGDADHRVQAYVYRLCITTNKENQVPFTKPGGYDPQRYANVLTRINRLKLLTLDKALTLYKLPNQKFDVNHMDLVNASWKYAEASYEDRNYIESYHKHYQQGLLYFLSNDEKVPEQLRNDTKRYGYAADEFADNDNWPYMLYVREGRRMIGKYVMRQQDAWDNPHKEDAIAIGSYFMDCHTVQRFITPAGEMLEEGEMKHAPFRPYEISYGAIIPKQKECENLFVSVCMSATHTIYGSLRMEPVFMMTGHAAGAASVLAIRDNLAIQQVDIQQLQKELISQGQILHYTPEDEFYIDKETVTGYVMDDADAILTGHWGHSVSAGPFLMYDYRFVNQSATETAVAVFEPDLPGNGIYEIQIMYSPDQNRSKAVRVVIETDDGEKIVFVDMTQQIESPDYWFSLGTYKFSKVGKPKVIISNQGTGGIVVADGIRFIKK